MPLVINALRGGHTHTQTNSKVTRCMQVCGPHASGVKKPIINRKMPTKNVGFVGWALIGR